MALIVYAGETVRVTAKDLTHSDSGPVLAGATVTVALFDESDVQVSTQSTTTAGSGDDWWIDFDAPATPGEYQVKASAVKSGATWKGREPLAVKAW